MNLKAAPYGQVKLLPGYRTVNQERGIRFIPLYELEEQRYSVYFPITIK